MSDNVFFLRGVGGHDIGPLQNGLTSGGDLVSAVDYIQDLTNQIINQFGRPLTIEEAINLNLPINEITLQAISGAIGAEIEGVVIGDNGELIFLDFSQTEALEREFGVQRLLPFAGSEESLKVIFDGNFNDPATDLSGNPSTIGALVSEIIDGVTRLGDSFKQALEDVPVQLSYLAPQIENKISPYFEGSVGKIKKA